ncbi:MAG: extracellular solute-binding protein [Chloroflexi bacterium]|nr:extracellular solute-binding protein [Chloroflexota bacterium]
MKAKGIGLIVFGLIFVLGACAPGPAPAETPAPAPKDAAVQSPAKAAWETEWADTLAAARKEGEVQVYTTFGADWRVAMNEAMSAKYGIALSILAGRSDELGARLLKEQQARVHAVDGFQAMSIATYFSQEDRWKEVFQPLEKMLLLPEVVDPGVWAGGKIPWVDPTQKSLMFYRLYVSVPVIVNTNLVAAQELKSWDDLLNPKWKGKIILSDPSTAGAAQLDLAMLAWRIRDWGFIDKLLAQQPFVGRDYSSMMAGLAQGKYALMIGPRKGDAQAFIDAGAPIKYVNFQDGVITTSGGGTVGIPKDNPHPKAAKIYLNFFLSKEGQTITAKVGGFPSARVDVPTDFLDPSVVLQPGMKTFSDGDPDFIQKYGDIVRRLGQTMQAYSK